MTTIEQYAYNASRAFRPGAYVDDMAKALRVIAELHRPAPYFPSECATCADTGDFDHPCEELRIIHDALGIDGKDNKE